MAAGGQPLRQIGEQLGGRRFIRPIEAVDEHHAGLERPGSSEARSRWLAGPQPPDLLIGKTLVAGQKAAVAVARAAVEESSAQDVLVDEPQHGAAGQVIAQMLERPAPGECRPGQKRLQVQTGAAVAGEERLRLLPGVAAVFGQPAAGSVGGQVMQVIRPQPAHPHLRGLALAVARLDKRKSAGLDETRLPGRIVRAVRDPSALPEHARGHVAAVDRSLAVVRRRIRP